MNIRGTLLTDSGLRSCLFELDSSEHESDVGPDLVSRGQVHVAFCVQETAHEGIMGSVSAVIYLQLITSCDQINYTLGILLC